MLIVIIYKLEIWILVWKIKDDEWSKKYISRIMHKLKNDGTSFIKILIYIYIYIYIIDNIVIVISIFLIIKNVIVLYFIIYEKLDINIHGIHISIL